MTATTATLGSELYDGQGEVLGPVATFGAQFFVFGALVYSFTVTGFDILPKLTPLALFAGAIGVLFLAPRLVLMRLPLSLLVLSMVGWICGSVMWSDNPTATSGGIQDLVPVLVGMVICAGLISLRDLVLALVWTVRFAVVLTLVIVAIYPETRVHIDVVGGSGVSMEGWHGWFPHKNIMTPFLVFGLLTSLTFDRSKVFRLATVVGIGALLVGSASVTGMSSAFLAVSVWVWLQLYKNLDIRNSSIFVISSISVAIFGLLGLAASLATLTSASGKDLTFTGRTLIWAASLKAWGERPLFGWGFGGILSADPVSPRTAQMWREIGFRVPHSHSGAIDLGVQLGIIGLVIFLVLWFTTLTQAMRLVREQPKIAAWIVSTMVVQLYISFSENVFMGAGWLPILFMFRTLLNRQHGMELETGAELVDRVRANIGQSRL